MWKCWNAADALEDGSPGREPRFVTVDYHSGRNGRFVRHQLIFN